jgi:hypothetical protein
MEREEDAVRTRGGEPSRAGGQAEAGVPAGFWIFGETPHAPAGFAATGALLSLPDAAPAWRPLAPLPGTGAGRVRCVAVDGALYAFREGSHDVLRYDPGADAWQTETRLGDGWHAFAVAALDGRIHLVGGRDAGNRLVRWHRAYVPAAGVWQACAPLSAPRCDMGAAALGGRVYVAGGTRPVMSRTAAEVESYDPHADTWTACPPMRHARADPGVAAAGGRLFVVGGREKGLRGATPSRRVEAFEPTAGRWKELDPVPAPAVGAALAELDGHLHLAGGDAGSGPTGAVLTYDPRAGSWSTRAEMGTSRMHHGLTAVGGRLYAAGGVARDGPTGEVETCRVSFELYGFVRS